MYPKRKTYLRGSSYQCHRVSTKSALDDMVEQSNALKKACKTVERASGGFLADGVFVPFIKKEKETWDVIEFMHSGFFRFAGEKVPMKQIVSYDPEAGTFQTGEGFFTLYPLPA